MRATLGGRAAAAQPPCDGRLATADRLRRAPTGCARLVRAALESAARIGGDDGGGVYDSQARRGPCAGRPPGGGAGRDDNLVRL
jgi:hypothetical protein